MKKYSGKADAEEVEFESEIDLDENFKIPTVTKTYTKEEPVTIDLGKVLNATQDLIWEEEFDASKEDALSYFHPCAEIINTLKLRQKKYDGYYYDEAGVLIALHNFLKESIYEWFAEKISNPLVKPSSWVFNKILRLFDKLNYLIFKANIYSVSI